MVEIIQTKVLCAVPKCHKCFMMVFPEEEKHNDQVVHMAAPNINLIAFSFYLYELVYSVILRYAHCHLHGKLVIWEIKHWWDSVLNNSETNVQKYAIWFYKYREYIIICPILPAGTGVASPSSWCRINILSNLGPCACTGNPWKPWAQEFLCAYKVEHCHCEDASASCLFYYTTLLVF